MNVIKLNFFKFILFFAKYLIFFYEVPKNYLILCLNYQYLIGKKRLDLKLKSFLQIMLRLSGVTLVIAITYLTYYC